ncbi:MAG: type IV toxin-antitoxin system AbiEi family antitoxin domain-containing protein [Bdellovibrionales bacterium]|nr:type IV toxin-antitoxin system AbiEi family antitoxin domain-containing protein [Bdellovibrionales bacterium]
MNSLKGIGAISRTQLSEVIKASKGGMTATIVAATLNVTRQEAGRLLSRWAKAGWLRRVRRGFYLSTPLEVSPEELAIENPWAVVSKIFEPGYIGGFSAVKHWDLSEQIFETTVFCTTKQFRKTDLNYSGIKIHLKTIKGYKLFGTKSVWLDSVKVLISDPSKTMVDILDDPGLGGGMRVAKDFFEAYMESEYKDVPLLIEYAQKMNNKTIFKRLGFLLETIGEKDQSVLDKLRDNISAGYSKFDPTIENKRIIKKWNLKIPASWEKEYDRKK